MLSRKGFILFYFFQVLLLGISNQVIAGNGNEIISTGYAHSCVITSDKKVACWGRNQEGQLGNATYVSSNKPVMVSGLTNIRNISAGMYHSCALDEAGKVYCWGANYYGELGSPSSNTKNIPILVPTVTNAVAVITGFLYTCILDSTGNVKCFGGANVGVSTSNLVTSNNNNVVSISGGFLSACALLNTGETKCSGQINGSIPNSGFTAISAGSDSACALTSIDGDTSVVGPKCWGMGFFPMIISPQPIDAKLISKGQKHTCYILRTGGVSCSGENNKGQLGNGEAVSNVSFGLAPVKNLFGVISLSSGFEHSCAITPMSGVQCWGSNSEGQLGYGKNADSHLPIQVQLIQPFIQTDHATLIGQVWHDKNGNCVKDTTESYLSMQTVFTRLGNLPELMEWTNSNGTYKFLDLPTVAAGGGYTTHVGVDKNWIQTCPKAPQLPFYKLQLTLNQTAPALNFGVAKVFKLYASSGAISPKPINDIPESEFCKEACTPYEYQEGTVVKLVATPYQYEFSDSPEGAAFIHEFVGWTGCDMVAGMTCTVTMDKDKTAKAVYKKVNNYLLTIYKVGNGKGKIAATQKVIDCGNTCKSYVPPNTKLNLVATPDQGFYFDSWSGGGCNGSTPTCTVTMSAAQTVYVVFKPFVKKEFSSSTLDFSVSSGKLSARKCATQETQVCLPKTCDFLGNQENRYSINNQGNGAGVNMSSYVNSNGETCSTLKVEVCAKGYTSVDAWYKGSTTISGLCK
jgi:hypothetical protein